jgi:hypothetical protein
MWSQLYKKVIKTWIPKHTSSEKPNLEKITQLLMQWKEKKNDSVKELINMCIGLWKNEDTMEWETSLQVAKIPRAQAHKMLFKISKTWCKLLRQYLWNPRCVEVQKYKQAPKQTTKNGKGKGKEKETEPYSPTRPLGTPQEEHGTKLQRKGKNTSKTQVRSSTSTSEKEAIQETHKEKESGTIDKLKEIIWIKIKEGKRWLGI